MTSEGEVQKTSEFLRRRKLRLQQVREQSKDIAKKIRQRAKVEKLRQIVELDGKKEKDYIHSQEKVVKKLEELYSRGLDNVGSSHKEARGLTQLGDLVEKTDLSHLRGREAAAELKRQKQQKLDELKKSLDRKIQAREAANILSREKSATTANRLSTKSSCTKFNVDDVSKSTPDDNTGDNELNDKDLPKEVSRNDMGTQWDLDIPTLAIPQDESIKGSVAADSDSNTDKQKRTDLFALSDEMPLSLRGGTRKTCDTVPSKLSSTLVSEYIQNRALRLRSSEISMSSKKSSEDLKNLRQTITRSRPFKPEGTAFTNICEVVEGQVLPVPVWHAETSWQCRSPRTAHYTRCLETQPAAHITHADLDKIYSSIRPVKPILVSSPVSTKARPLTMHKCFGQYKESGISNNSILVRGKGSENALNKKRSVTMYNHSSRDSRDVPRADEQLVRRDHRSERDAYSQAISESTTAVNDDKHKKYEDTTTKVAMARQSVEKEYKDTIAFLNSLPKNTNNRPINNAYKDDHRLQAQRENRQRILQQEFKSIEQESRRQASHVRKKKSGLPDRSHLKRSKSPDSNVENNFNDRDFEYSWMPIPESDSNLAVHTIPTGVRAGAGAAVTFSAVDTYHEYRSRHKHTPPTKDTACCERRPHKRTLQTVVIHNDDNTLSGLSITSDNSSTDGQQLDPKENNNSTANETTKELTDAERIIIYKILSYKHRKSNKPAKTNSADDVARGNKESNATDNERTSKSSSEETAGKLVEPTENDALVTPNNDPLNSDNLKEGVYEVAGNTEFSFNILNSFPTNVDPWQTISDRKHWWDNLETMYYAELNKNHSKKIDNKCDKHKSGPCSRITDAAGNPQPLRKICTSLKCKSHSVENKPSAETSSNPPEKRASEMVGVPAPGTLGGPSPAAAASAPEAAFVKLIDDREKQDGNFYIGATGFLKDDAYEVIIQLRKKDAMKEMGKPEEVATEKEMTDAGNNITNSPNKIIAQSLESKAPEQKAVSDDGEYYSEATDRQRCMADRGSFMIGNNIPAANAIQDDSKHRPNSAISENIPLTKTQHDKSVSTCFKDTFPLPESHAKIDPITATSAYTQTTPSSPNPRPVYIHMSSSTSTAYMSPPEVVLPNFFKRGRVSRNSDETDYRNLNHQDRHCKKYCNRKRNKNILTEPKIGGMKLNTARTPKVDVGCGPYNIYRETRESASSSPVSHVTNCRCRNRNMRGDSKLYCKYSHRSCHRLSRTKPSLSTWNSMSAALHNKKSKTSTYSSKSFLSPMIREYIHKLLSLNREGIKTIQVLNQDCSSVNTPTSSVINLPTNVCNKTYFERNLGLDNDISLEHIKNVLKEHIFRNNYSMYQNVNRLDDIKKVSVVPRNTKMRKRNTRKKIMHKVKSLNISKKIVIEPASTKNKVNNSTQKQLTSNLRSLGSPSPEPIESNGESGDRNIFLNGHTTEKSLPKLKSQHGGKNSSTLEPKTTISSGNNFLKGVASDAHVNCTGQPINTSTQTYCTLDGEMNFIKLAEDKLQNMEKIADLTEKCTKRLSNLAKVLEEVRKNKSLAYSQISTPDSTSESDQKSDRKVNPDNLITNSKIPLTVGTANIGKDEKDIPESSDYELSLSDFSKPVNIKTSEINNPDNLLPDNSNTEFSSKPATSVTMSDYYRVTNTKCRNKPPPALLRINLKRPDENIVPHELSTVIEVDSPLSVKFKSQSSATKTNQSAKHFTESKRDEKYNEEAQLNPELILSIINGSSNDKLKLISTESSDFSKLQMMDLNQFNEIMLRPFISLQEYAQNYYDGNMDTKRESTSKEYGLTDDISSLHSDGSLPDVVAELLKRKLISEPFRFDTASNVNSTTFSSESTVSVLALSKARKDRNRSKLTANKENVGETSDSFSISSNPDLENALKKLGMGWASSTLKKTKERLALSSSSNTSSSSLSHIKFKNSTKQDVPVTDSVSSVPNLAKKPALKRPLDLSKNAEQQTSLSNSMTVKEFLTKELAKKITFTDKSDRNDTNPEFVSLFETQLPANLKNSSQTLVEDNSGDSAPSGNNNRARTSTPVNIFKSVTYRSSSSSNISNGLFSNADDLSSVKLTSTSMRCQSTSEKDDLTIPNCSLKMRKDLSDCSKTDSC